MVQFSEGVRGGGIRIQGQLRVVGMQVGWAWEPLGEHVGRLSSHLRPQFPVSSLKWEGRWREMQALHAE